MSKTDENSKTSAASDVCEVAKTVQEATELLEDSFEFVCAFEDAKLFRKLK